MVWVGADVRRAAAELAAGHPVVLLVAAGEPVPESLAAAAAGKGGRLAVFVVPGPDAGGEPPPEALEMAAELFGRHP